MFNLQRPTIIKSKRRPLPMLEPFWSRRRLRFCKRPCAWNVYLWPPNRAQQVCAQFGRRRARLTSEGRHLHDPQDRPQDIMIYIVMLYTVKCQGHRVVHAGTLKDLTEAADHSDIRSRCPV